MNDIIAVAPQMIRVSVALGLIGYLPGTMLVRWLFPPQSLNRFEHFYVSVLASLCLAALTAYALAHSNDGLTPHSLSLWLAQFTLVFLAATGLRWHYRAQKSTQRLVQAAAPHRHIQARILLPGLFGGLALIVVAAIAFVANNNPARYGLTEFYLAPQNYQAAAVQYTRRDGTLILPVEVVNRDNRTITYRFAARLDGQLLNLPARPTLMNGERWTNELVIPLSSDATANRIDILLYIDHDRAIGSISHEGAKQVEPIARLRLWLQDESTQEGE